MRRKFDLPVPRLLMSGVLLLALGARFSAGAEPTIKMATSARFDLSADEATKAIDKGLVTGGQGRIERPGWLPEGRRSGAYTVNFPISPLTWREVVVAFRPASSGSVTLTLMGPWEESSPGVLTRQDVLWDSLRIEGASLGDGGFEGRATSWRRNGGAIEGQSKDVPAQSGTQLARTWHNETLSTTFPVTRGQSVTIHAFARAVFPPGYHSMKRIQGKSTPAHCAARGFLRGANLGNGLEVPPGQNWGVHYSERDIHQIRKEGFDHVRIPIGWHHYSDPAPEYRLSPEIFRKVDLLVNAALREQLRVLINIHHFDQLTSDPDRYSAEFHAIWSQIAEHYRKAPPSLAFELLNEPRDAATTEVMNPIYADAVRRIRETNPDRTIVFGPGMWNSIGELPRLRVPDDDQNIIVTVHCYDPFEFTHQGADWAGSNDDRKVVGIIFPGPPHAPLHVRPGLKLSPGFRTWLEDYNIRPVEVNPSGGVAIQSAVRRIREWSDYYGRPVYLGEFGAYTKADPGSRANYYRTFRQALESEGIGWAIWDWKAGFNYWDAKSNRPLFGMRDALFGHGEKSRSSDSNERPARSER